MNETTAQDVGHVPCTTAGVVVYNARYLLEVTLDQGEDKASIH